jgi:hypothetical protein
VALNSVRSPQGLGKEHHYDVLFTARSTLQHYSIQVAYLSLLACWLLPIFSSLPVSRYGLYDI